MLSTKLLLNIYNRITRRKILQELSTLKSTIQYDKKKIRAYLDKKLTKNFIYISEHVPFYKKLFDKKLQGVARYSPIEILKQLPVLEKDDIRRNLDNLLSDEYKNTKRICFDSTGGSTGQPLKFAYDRQYKDFRWAMIYYNLAMVGYKLGDCHGFVYGGNYDVKKQYSLRQKMQDFMMNAFQVNAFFLNDKSLMKFAKKCRKRKPKFLIGYSTALYQLALFVERKGIDLNFDFIESTSEVLTKEMRDTFHRVFGCETFDRYGCREVGNIAHECKAHNGLHVNWQSVYVEIVNKGKYPWLSEDYGDIVVTSLRNKGMPFIRYETGDIGRIEDNPCRCGLCGPRLFLGGAREGDLLCAADGSYVSSPALTLIYKDLAVQEIQFVQRGKTDLLVNVIRASEYTDSSEKILLERLRKIFTKNMDIEFAYIENVKKEKSGKYRFTKRLF